MEWENHALTPAWLPVVVDPGISPGQSTETANRIQKAIHDLNWAILPYLLFMLINSMGIGDGTDVWKGSKMLA